MVFTETNTSATRGLVFSGRQTTAFLRRYSDHTSRCDAIKKTPIFTGCLWSLIDTFLLVFRALTAPAGGLEPTRPAVCLPGPHNRALLCTVSVSGDSSETLSFWNDFEREAFFCVSRAGGGLWLYRLPPERTRV